jgi:hypothetical protein
VRNFDEKNKKAKEKKSMEVENKYASKGVGGTALGLSIGAVAAELLGGNLGGILGGGNKSNCGTNELVGMLGAMSALGANGHNCCHENTLINRYEAAQQARISELETEVKLRDSNIYTDQKILEVYKYFDGENKDIRNALAAQAVLNQKTADAFDMVRNDLICTKNELYSAIARERDERCCGDNAIVTYVNGTFYPKLVADVTAGTTTTAQTLYNPLPNCGKCGC